MIKAHGARPTYGELLPKGLDRIFGHISPSGCSFLDMGSGIGRAVLAAGVGFPVHRADGVELSPIRSQAAREALDHIQAQTGRTYSIRFFEGDMLSFNVQR